MVPVARVPQCWRVHTSVVEWPFASAYPQRRRLSWPCCQIDQVGVIYYDRDIIKKVDKAGCCKPCGTHNSPCPTCFDMCVPRCEVVPSCLRPLLTRLLPPPLASLQQLR